jgi:hypothetical protein
MYDLLQSHMRHMSCMHAATCLFDMRIVIDKQVVRAQPCAAASISPSAAEKKESANPFAQFGMITYNFNTLSRHGRQHDPRRGRDFV